MITTLYLVVLIIFPIFTIFLFIWIKYRNKIDYSIVIPRNMHTHDVQIKSDCVPILYLLIWRICCCILWVITWIFLFILAKSGIPFAFYTQWNYILFLIYYVCSSILTYKEYKHKGTIIGDKYVDWLRKLCWVIFITECANQILICLVVWFLLIPTADERYRKELFHFSNLSMHNISFICLFVDLMVTRIPIPVYGGIYCVLLANAYIIFAVIVHEISGRWMYDFLDYSVPLNAVLLIMLFISHYICYLFIILCAYLRDNYCCKMNKMERDINVDNIECNENTGNDVEITNNNQTNLITTNQEV